MLDIAKFDYTMLTLVVAAMVLKPGWGDLLTFAVMVAILVVAGLVFLRRGMSAGRA